MTHIYKSLCVVRTSLINAVGIKYISGGKALNISNILDNIVSEMHMHADIIHDIQKCMSEEQLLDLGFDYIDETSNYMMFPIWLYPFIPEMTILINSDNNPIVKGIDNIEIFNDHWLNVGFYYGK